MNCIIIEYINICKYNIKYLLLVVILLLLIKLSIFNIYIINNNDILNTNNNDNITTINKRIRKSIDLYLLLPLFL